MRQPIRFALYYFLGMVVLSLIGSVWITNEYWGFLLGPPGLLDSAKTITDIDHLIPVQTSDCNTPKQCKFVIDPSQSISAKYDPDDDSLEERLLRYLQATGKLPSSFDYHLNGIVNLHSPMMQSPIIASPIEGYTNHNLHGIIMIGRTDSGQQRAFINARGGQVQDDHYPYYEAIFAIEQNGKSVQYLDGQRFFFDIAGFEGFEGLSTTLLIFLLLVVIFGLVPMAIIITMDVLWMWLQSLRSHLFK